MSWSRSSAFPNDADKAPGVVELLRVAVLLVEIDRVLPRQAGAPAPASPVCLPGEFGDGRRRRALDLPLERRLGQTRSATFC